MERDVMAFILLAVVCEILCVVALNFAYVTATRCKYLPARIVFPVFGVGLAVFSYIIATLSLSEVVPLSK